MSTAENNLICKAGRENWWRSGPAIVIWIAIATILAHLATGWQYGFDRDELMALEDARHLAWGYVQYPPMTAFFGWIALKVFGTSLVGFRLFAALAQASALVLTGRMAREMGGAKWAQVVATLAGVPFCLGGGALMQYISFDYVCWVFVAWCVVKAVAGMPRTANAWWMAAGLGVGLGMLAKYTMLFLVAGMFVGLLATGARRYLCGVWLWLGVVGALTISLPNFLWQWARDFVSLDFLHFLHARDVAAGLTDWFLAGQAELTLLALPLAVAGLWFYFLSPGGKRFRILGWMFIAPLLLFLVLRGRPYYMAPGYPMLYAAGAVWVERKRWSSSGEVPASAGQSRERRVVDGLPVLAALGNKALALQSVRVPPTRTPLTAQLDLSPAAHSQTNIERNDATLRTRPFPGCSRSHGWIGKLLWVALILDIAIAAAVALPIAPVGSRWWKFASRVDSVFPEEVGWPEFVQCVAQVWWQLPADERLHAGILAGNYGEVGALNLYGVGLGLPRAISGVNSSWERGYGDPAPQLVVVVGYSRQFLEQHFASVEVAGRIWNRYAVANEETVEDPDIFVCRGLQESWPEFWRKARRFA